MGISSKSIYCRYNAIRINQLQNLLSFSLVASLALSTGSVLMSFSPNSWPSTRPPAATRSNACKRRMSFLATSSQCHEHSHQCHDFYHWVRASVSISAFSLSARSSSLAPSAVISSCRPLQQAHDAELHGFRSNGPICISKPMPGPIHISMPVTGGLAYYI